jgi:hypothetical protein
VIQRAITGLIREVQALAKRVERLETQELGATRTGNLIIANAAPELRFSETDQSLPAGLWRIRLQGDDLLIEVNTAAGGDFSTQDQLMKLLGSGIIQIED